MDIGSSVAPCRVLAVDDDPVSLAIAAVLLEAEGCVVLQAESGEKALDLLAASDPPAILPDCILADLRMPGLAGSELARCLRQAAPQALLLGMSATPPARLDGYDGLLKKPLSPETLRDALFHRQTPSAPEAEAADSSEVLDPAIYDRLTRAISPPALEEVFGVFFQDTYTRLAAMRSSDPASICREAHTIKGGASMVGALQVSAAAAAVELGIDDPGDRMRKLDEIEAHCRRAEIILKQRLKA